MIYLHFFMTNAGQFIFLFIEIADSACFLFLKFELSEKHTKFEKIFLMVLTNQLIYLVNVKNMRQIF